MSHPPLTPAQWAEARALFDLLADLPAAEREAVLADSGAEPAVLAEVRSLLAHADDAEATHGGASGFLAAPAQPSWASGESGTAAPAPDEPDRIGQRIGAWRITGVLGRGGMGEVWAAERADGAYEGRAAVKVLKRGLDSQRVLARFAQEQRALARLNHPHIAHLLDAGRTPDGLPYFVMEAVDGQPIDQACTPRTLEQRLQLFLQLADAVAHAHRQLLVHRDLKPSNVLVTADGRVKLLDFGIAKALDPLEGESAGTTVAGERPFTPHYASPEQVRGDPVGTGTDIYSLGVLLYVMLTGVRPYGRGATSAQEAARSVLEEDPTRPSALSPGLVADPQWMATRRRLAGDLDNILLKALDKRPEARYPSVDALAADIRAHLAGYPVSARAATWGYQARKFLGRHRLPVALAGAALLALVGGLAATLWQAREAEAARAQAEAQRAVAEARFAQVRQMANQLVFKYHDQIEFLPGALAVREALLSDAVAFMDQLRQGGVTDPGLAEELAGTYYRISRLQGADRSLNTGQLGASEANLAKALALTPAYLNRPEASIQAQSLVVSMQIARAEGLQRRGRLAEAEAALRDGQAVLDRALARDPRDSWALAAAVSFHGVAARILGGHPDHAHLGRWQAGCEAADRARAAADATAAADPANVYVPDTVGFTLGAQASCRLLAGRLDEAAALRTQQIALRDQMAERMPEDIDFRWQRALARAGFAEVKSAQGRHADALALLDTALGLGRAARDAEPANVAGQGLWRDLQVLALRLRAAAGPAAGAASASMMASASASGPALLAQAEALLAELPVTVASGFADRRRRADALLAAARAARARQPARAAGWAAEAARLMQPAGADDDNAARRWRLAQALTEQAEASVVAGDAAAARARAGEALSAWGATPTLPPALQPTLARARVLAAFGR